MFLQLCCKVQFKDPQVLHYKCNIAVRYLKPGYALVQHTGLWCTIRQDQKQHKWSSSSVSVIGLLQCKTLHDSWSTITELVNMEVDGHRLKKARDQAHYRRKNQTLADPNSPAHMNLLIWQPQTLPVFTAVYHTAPAVCQTPGSQTLVKLRDDPLLPVSLAHLQDLQHGPRTCESDWKESRWD